MQYSKGEESAQSKPDESTANFNAAEQVKEEPRPSGNKWRSAPTTKMVASMKTVRLNANKNITGTMGQAPQFTGRKNKVKKMAMKKKIRNKAGNHMKANTVTASMSSNKSEEKWTKKYKELAKTRKKARQKSATIASRHARKNMWQRMVRGL